MTNAANGAGMTPPEEDRTALTLEDLRGLRDAHDPTKQDGNVYARCDECHFTRHPCDTFAVCDTAIKFIEDQAAVLGQARGLLKRAVACLDDSMPAMGSITMGEIEQAEDQARAFLSRTATERKTGDDSDGL